MPDPVSLNPRGIISVLAKHEVKYILIGALAARLQGFPRLTANANITPATDPKHLNYLAAALRALDAKVFTESQPGGLDFECTAENLKQSKLWNFVTSSGRLDIIFEPAGTAGYDDLIKNAKRYKVYGETISAASLSDIIRTKKAADRPQDRQDIILLREILERKKTE